MTILRVLFRNKGAIFKIVSNKIVLLSFLLGLFAHGTRVKTGFVSVMEKDDISRGLTSVAIASTHPGVVVPIIESNNIRSKCPHGKQTKTRCAECLGHPIPKLKIKKCPHNLRKSQCEDCIGHPITKQTPAPPCEHGRQKSRCLECHGVCEHGIGKWRCLDCGATPRKPEKMCPHNKRKSRCIECVDGCVYGRIKNSCKDCGFEKKKAVIKKCAHNKIKRQCDVCSSHNYCIHKRKLYTCVDCRGGGICIHLNVKSKCKECQKPQAKTPKRIYKNCVHDIPMNNCKLCGHQKICVHGKRLHLCRECGGNSFCACGRMKNTCPKHGGIALCINCINWPDPQHKNPEYGNYCARCFKNKWPEDPKSKHKRQKVKEDRVKTFLQENDISFVQDRAVLDRDSSCDKSTNRPDFQVQHTYQELVSIYLEIDESQHQTRSYTDTCELVRLNDIAISHQYRRPIVVLRYNPDPFTVGSHHITCKQLSRDNKEKILMQQLKNVMQAAAFPETFPRLLRVIKIGYNCMCQNTTGCGFVHLTDYEDQESICREYDRMQ